jgi:hypothetical protein
MKFSDGAIQHVTVSRYKKVSPGMEMAFSPLCVCCCLILEFRYCGSKMDGRTGRRIKMGILSDGVEDNGWHIRWLDWFT